MYLDDPHRGTLFSVYNILIFQQIKQKLLALLPVAHFLFIRNFTDKHKSYRYRQTERAAMLGVRHV